MARPRAPGPFLVGRRAGAGGCADLICSLSHGTILFAKLSKDSKYYPSNMYNKYIIILLSLVFGVCVGAVYAYASVARQLDEKGFGTAIPLPIVGALASVGSYAAICNGVLVDKAGFAVG